MKKPVILLGVNIDHVATIRQARLTDYPDPVRAALEAENAGADSITLHLREDRRHIQERDVYSLKDAIQTPMNLEMAMTNEMVSFAEKVKPEYCCIVPEKRQELTTEGGLDVVGQVKLTAETCKRLDRAGIRVSLFIDADINQINAAADAGAKVIELHTGHFADAKSETGRNTELQKIINGVRAAMDCGLQVNAGHGLNCENVQPIAAIDEVHELNIGHSIIARSIFIGMGEAVKEIKKLMQEARQ